MTKKIKCVLLVALLLTTVMGTSLTAYADEPVNHWNDSWYDTGIIDTAPGDGEVVLRIFNDGADADVTEEYYLDNDLVYSYTDSIPGGSGVGHTNGWYALEELCDIFLPMFCPEKTIDDVEHKIRYTWNGNTKTFSTYIYLKSSGNKAVPGNIDAHIHSFSWQTITEPTEFSDGLEGEMCSCGATRNVQPLSAYAYALNQYATPMIDVAKAGQTITFEFGEWNSFPKSFMEKLVPKSEQNISFVFKYKWNHKLQIITIPAGTEIDLNHDWYGPAKMEQLYGMY